MNAKTELQNYIEHYGQEGISAMIAELEERGYTVQDVTEYEDDKCQHCEGDGCEYCTDMSLY